jgi:hypothetical protein
VTVSADKVTVDYVRALLPSAETGGTTNGSTACSYSMGK